MIALPKVFIENIKRQLGDQSQAYFDALEAPYQRGLRVNTRKKVCDLQTVFANDLKQRVPWWKDAYYLTMESIAGAHPLHEAGAYYLQEPSAMAPVSILSPKPMEMVLDLCAAPGGKSTQIADMLEGQGLLVCNEPEPSRARILSRNIERMGVSNALVVSAMPEKLAQVWKGCFDAILVDAPCSGEGMFRRHPETRTEWNEKSPEGCATRQKRILQSAITMLKPGGRLVYSTCTLNEEENEKVIGNTLALFPCMQTISFSLPIENETLHAKEGMLRLYPHVVQGEGHFMALLQKDLQTNTEETPLVPASIAFGKPDSALCKAYDAFAQTFFLHSEAIPQPTAQLGTTLLACPDIPLIRVIKVLRAGMQLGVGKGRVFAPDHAMALAIEPACKIRLVNEEKARAYHRGETLPMDEEAKGYFLVMYEGFALGFGKSSEGQLKNHYPKGLRRG